MGTMRMLRWSVAAALLWLAGIAVAAPALKFWAVTGSVEDVSLYRSLAATFTQRTGIPVEVTPLAWGNFQTKYFTAMAAGLPPDVGVTNLGGPFDYGSVGGLVDLRTEFPKESQKLEGLFEPKMLDMFTVGKHLYGLPCDLSTLVVYYRTDIFAKLGLKAPATWSELNATIDSLEANKYQYYFGFTNGAQWALGLYTLPFNLPGITRRNNTFSSDGQPAVNWNDRVYQQAVMEALNLWYMHNSPGQDLGSRMTGMFRSSKPDEAVPLVIELHNDYLGFHHDAPEIDGKWDVIPWPHADHGKPYNIMGGTSYVVFRKSKLKKEALKWLLFLNSDEAQQAIVANRLSRENDAALAIPATKSMWSPANDAFWNQNRFARDRRLFDVVRETFHTFGTVPSVQGSTEAGRLESNMLDGMGAYIVDGLDGLAAKKGVSRSELIRGLSRHTDEAEHAQFVAQVAEKLKQEYAAISPQAVQLLTEGEAHYRARYGDIVDRLPQLERQRNALDVVKGIAILILLAGFVAVLARPANRKHLISYLFVAPPLVLATLFVFVPAVVAFYLSFTDYHPVLPLSTAEWVGTKNYSDEIHSGDLSASLLRTLKYAVISLPVGIAISLVFAYLLNYKLRAQRFWRFLYFSPLVTSVVSIALIFTQLFLGGKQGWLNAILMRTGLVKDPVQFLTSEHTFLNCVITLAIWQGLAFTILVFLAGLQQIPDQLYEAAEIDGASSPRRFWHVALPGIRPQIFFVTVLGLIGSFQVFELIYTLAGKSGDAQARFGPNDSALTVVPMIYHFGFETYEMGKAAAVAYVLFAIILALTVVQLAVYRRVEARS